MFSFAFYDRIMLSTFKTILLKALRKLHSPQPFPRRSSKVAFGYSVSSHFYSFFLQPQIFLILFRINFYFCNLYFLNIFKITFKPFWSFEIIFIHHYSFVSHRSALCLVSLNHPSHCHLHRRVSKACRNQHNIEGHTSTINTRRVSIQGMYSK